MPNEKFIRNFFFYIESELRNYRAVLYVHMYALNMNKLVKASELSQLFVYGLSCVDAEAVFIERQIRHQVVQSV